MDDDSANLKWLGKLLRNEAKKLRLRVYAWYTTDPPILRFVKNNTGLILRTVFVILGPLILFFVIYGNISTLRGCFNPISQSSVTVTQQASEILATAYKTVSVFNPPIQLYADWLPYDISIYNGSKVAFSIKRSDGRITNYKEGPVDLLIQTDQASTTVGYEQSSTIAKGVPLSAIPDYHISISGQFGVNDWNAKFKKGELLTPQVDVNHGDTCLSMKLETTPYLLLIYIECWIVFIGLIILIKESITLIWKGFGAYFTSR